MDSNKNKYKVGIIGSGIVGLSVASIIKENYPNIFVRVHTNGIFNETTSWGAAGMMKLKKGEYPMNNPDDIRRWFKIGFDHYLSVIKSNKITEFGCQLTDMYELYDNPDNRPDLFGDLYIGTRKVDLNELASLGLNKRGMTCGLSYKTITLESRYLLPTLTNLITAQGAEIKIENVCDSCNIQNTDSNESRQQSIADWALKYGYDAIVNCSGLGSRKLFGDSTIIPVRGQLVRMSAPWIKSSFITNEEIDTYVYTCREGIVIGGFRQVNCEDTKVRNEETMDLLKRASSFYPALRSEDKTMVLEEWAGMRPTRPSIRVETQILEASDSTKIPVIHNYGHGARGITLSYGTSVDAVKLLSQAL